MAFAFLYPLLFSIFELMKKLLLVVIILFSIPTLAQKIPKGFVYLHDIDSTIKAELRYISHHNFIGKPIDGYFKNTVITTKKAAISLKIIQKKLIPFQLSLKIFDAYRPQQAVNHFVRWANVLNDTLMKHDYYPTIPKNKLFELGYIAEKSGHTRGSTVDLTIVDLKTDAELDMGSPYDFFGIQSHPMYSKITKIQRANRLLLRNLMLSNGFIPYENEWWHFTLKNEPFPKTYFNFPVDQ